MSNNEELLDRLLRVERQVEFSCDMTIVLSIGFYMVILAAFLCSYIFIRNRLERACALPPPPPPPSPNVELERLVAKLISQNQILIKALTNQNSNASTNANVNNQPTNVGQTTSSIPEVPVPEEPKESTVVLSVVSLEEN